MLHAVNSGSVDRLHALNDTVKQTEVVEEKSTSNSLKE